MTPIPEPAIHDEPIRRVSRREAFRVWGRIGLQSFGGPAGQIATMHRLLVDDLAWVSERRFLDALNFCNLLPGPEAQQLATYLGWVQGGVRGALVAGGLFILPGFVVLLILSSLYMAVGGLPVVAAAFAGLKPAVVAVVIAALLRIGRRALATRWSFAVAAAAFLALFAFHLPFPFVVMGAGMVGAVLGPRLGAAVISPAPVPFPSYHGSARTLMLGLAAWWFPLIAVAAASGAGHVFTMQAQFFSQAALVTFGGAYAVLAYVGDQVVHRYGWLTPAEMLDGLALAETTPGPLILVLQYVGFVSGYRLGSPLAGWYGGLIGSLVTVWATFAPSFVLVLTGAPYLEWLRSQRRLQTALAAITAAVVGVIANLSVWFAVRVLFERLAPVAAGPLRFDLPVPESLDPLALAITVAALVAMQRFRVGMIPTLGAAALAGMVAHLVR